MLLTKYSYEVEPQPLLLLQSEQFQVNDGRIQSSGKSSYDRTEFPFKGCENEAAGRQKKKQRFGTKEVETSFKTLSFPEFLNHGPPLDRHTPLMITFLSMQTTVISGIRYLNHLNCDTYPHGGRQDSVIKKKKKAYPGFQHEVYRAGDLRKVSPSAPSFPVCTRA